MAFKEHVSAFLHASGVKRAKVLAAVKDLEDAVLAMKLTVLSEFDAGVSDVMRSLTAMRPGMDASGLPDLDCVIVETDLFKAMFQRCFAFVSDSGAKSILKARRQILLNLTQEFDRVHIAITKTIVSEETSLVARATTRFEGKGMQDAIVSYASARPTDTSCFPAIAISPSGDQLALTLTDKVAVVCMRSVKVLRLFGSPGKGPCQFGVLERICFSSSGRTVLVSDIGNDRVEELTVDGGEHVRFVAAGMVELGFLRGVDCNADVIVTSHSAVIPLPHLPPTTETTGARSVVGNTVCVFDYRSGDLIRKFGRTGTTPGLLNGITAVRILLDGTAIAVAEHSNCRVSLFGITGTFIRCFSSTSACTPYNDVCVTQSGDIVAVSDNGEGMVLHPDWSKVEKPFVKDLPGAPALPSVRLCAWGNIVIVARDMCLGLVHLQMLS